MIPTIIICNHFCPIPGPTSTLDKQIWISGSMSTTSTGNKHSRCSDNTFSQTQYFREAYRLWSTYNAIHLFSQTTWIVPGYPYRYIDLELAIRRTIGGKSPLLMCKYNGVSPYLVEVVICFDYNAANPVDCVRTTNCGALVWYSL